MTLVGPRPHAVAEDNEIGDMIPNYWLRYSVKPGLTGLAQIRGQRGPMYSISTIEERVASDLEYRSQASIIVDLKILVRTVPIVVVGKNSSSSSLAFNQPR
jgi:putative colanic acid biosynthesis UDP-glucose lipid carrier transferase